jgi:hypothetical protein
VTLIEFYEAFMRQPDGTYERKLICSNCLREMESMESLADHHDGDRWLCEKSKARFDN